jgi:hypothetical protein
MSLDHSHRTSRGTVSARRVRETCPEVRFEEFDAAERSSRADLRERRLWVVSGWATSRPNFPEILVSYRRTVGQ